MASICLNMIVKNESHIIQKTLENLIQYIHFDYWVICDTGSTDQTVDLIQRFFDEKKIPGEIIYEPWQNFEHNRNVALNACLGKSDYVFIFDADDEFTGEFKLPVLEEDSYFFNMTSESGTTHYLRKLLIKNDGTFAWKGVLHEFLQENRQIRNATISGQYAVISGRKGARSLDQDKYQKDAEILKKAFIENKDRDLQPRYAFYCAQSYRDANMIEQAIEWYQKRIDIDQGWSEEKYCSYEQLGLLLEKKMQYSLAIDIWQQGVVFEPLRAECWYHLARRHSWNQHAILAYCFASQAIKVVLPKDNRLFLNTDIYGYWCWYEYTLNAAKLGKFEEAYQGLKSLIVHAPLEVVEKVAPYFEAIHPYVLIDQFANVANLGVYFKKNQRIDLLEILLEGNK